MSIPKPRVVVMHVQLTLLSEITRTPKLSNQLVIIYRWWWHESFFYSRISMFVWRMVRVRVSFTCATDCTLGQEMMSIRQLHKKFHRFKLNYSLGNTVKGYGRSGSNMHNQTTVTLYVTTKTSRLGIMKQLEVYSKIIVHRKFWMQSGLNLGLTDTLQCSTT